MESKTSAENTEKEKDKKGPNQENAQPNTAGQNNPQNNAQKEETKSKLNEVLDTFFKPDDKKLSINLFLEKSKSDGGLYKQSIKKESEKTNEQNEEKLEVPKKSLTDEDKGNNEISYNGEKRKSIVENEDFGFGKVKTFDQLKAKIIQFRKEFEKERLDLDKQKENMNLITNKFNKVIGETGDNPSPINDKINIMEKKLKFLLGDTSLEDIENEDKLDEQKAENERKKMVSLQEMNRKIAKF